MIYLIYFLVGVIQDIILTLNWRYISEGRAMASAISAFISCVTSLIILYSIIVSITQKNNFLAILMYAAGVGVGTYIGIKGEKFLNKIIPQKKKIF